MTGRKKHGAASVALICSVLMAGGGCKKAETTKEVATEKAAVKTSFTPAVARDVPTRVNVSGTLDPEERSEIPSQTSGVATQVRFDVGDRVKRGDVLVELDRREAAMRLDMANATAAAGRARLGLDPRSNKLDVESVSDVKIAKEGADLANLEFDRAKALFESGAISKAQFDLAKSTKERADSGYESARNGATQAYSSLLASQSQAGLSSKGLEDTLVRAPFDGIVEARRISTGEFAPMGRVTFVLVSDKALRFRFDVPERQSALVKVGDPIEVAVAAFPDRKFVGQVKRIGASVKAQTRTFPIEAEIPNPAGELKPGFFATGSVDLAGTVENITLVPKAALREGGTSSRLYVKAGNVVEERLVVSGRTLGDLVEVSGQIKAGEQVATAALDKLADRTPIEE